MRHLIGILERRKKKGEAGRRFIEHDQDCLVFNFRALVSQTKTALQMEKLGRGMYLSSVHSRL